MIRCFTHDRTGNSLHATLLHYPKCSENHISIVAREYGDLWVTTREEEITVSFLCIMPDEDFLCRFVLRNWIAQNAIQGAESGEYSEVKRVLELLEQPFSDIAIQAVGDGKQAASAQSGKGTLQYDGPVPQWAKRLCVSCSS